jgi:hypothetical protein
MKVQSSFAMWRLLLLLPALLLLSNAGAAQGGKKNSCEEAQPEKMCNASNTCGTGSAACTVDVKRTGDAAAAEPDIPDAKQKALFCVKSGTKVTFHSTSKNTGFIVDFGPSSPFDPPGTVRGGSDREVSVVAKRPGCFKYSAGACVSGSISGMCGNVDQELVVTGSSE